MMLEGLDCTRHVLTPYKILTVLILEKHINITTDFAKTKTKTKTLIMSVSIIDVAKFIFELECRKFTNVLGPLKLQKLCFYIQSFYLVVWDAPLFEDDFYKLDNGPCNKCTWRVFSRFKRKETNEVYNLSLIKEMPGDSSKLGLQQKDFITSCYKLFLNTNGPALSARTHMEEPFNSTTSNRVIEKEKMKKFSESSINALCDIATCLFHSEDKNVQKAIALSLKNAVKHGCRHRCFAVFNSIKVWEGKNEANQILLDDVKDNKWKYQSDVEALVCYLFMPSEFIRQDIGLSSYFHIPVVIARLEICVYAQNPLASYYLHLYMKDFLCDLFDRDDEEDDDNYSDSENQTDNYENKDDRKVYDELCEFSCQLLKRCTTVNMSDAGDFYEAGLLFWLTNRREIAIKAFEKAKSTAAYNIIGDISGNSTYYDEALKIDPNNIYTQVKLMMQMNGQLAEAIKLVSERQDLPEQHLLLYYLVSDDVDRKIQHLKDAASKLDDPTLLEMAGRRTAEKRQYDEAFSLFKQSAKDGNTYAYHHMINIMKKQKKGIEEQKLIYTQCIESGGLMCFGEDKTSIATYRQLVLNRLSNIKTFIEEGI